MSSEILINAVPGETRVALVEEGRLCEVRIFRRGVSPLAGNIYLGRIEKRMPGLEAAFVDIGLERSAFLPLNKERNFNEGEKLLVQVTKDPLENKGAVVSTDISLGGRLLVFFPAAQEVKISRRIEDEAERERLQTLIEGLAGGEGGFVIRTAAAGAGEKALKAEATFLRNGWAEVWGKKGDASAPARLYGADDPLAAVLHQHGGEIGRIRIDRAAVLSQARQFCRDSMPDLLPALEHHTEGPIFSLFDVEAEIERALARRLTLPSGGVITFDMTEALTAVDVDSGGHGGRFRSWEAILAANLEAAQEIARQIRLRNIGGLILIDFIRMAEAGNRHRVIEALRAACAADPVPTKVHGMTRTGLTEVTRRRIHAPLARAVLAACPECGGGQVKSAEAVAYDVVRALIREAGATAGGKLRITAAAEVAAVLDDGAKADLSETAKLLGREVTLTSDPDFPPERYEIAVQ